MRRMPPLMGLRAFEAAARHLSFKLAANELGVTPTAISHQIKILEEECGQLLFCRQPRPLSLSVPGKQLFPIVRDGFDQFADAWSGIKAAETVAGLRVTTTSAFAARWLLPKLSLWQQEHPDIPLDIIGTYDVLDLNAGDADVAIRYARHEPGDGVAIELFRDTFYVVGSPSLVGLPTGPLKPQELMRYPRIETGWPPNDFEAPTWQRWDRESKNSRAEVSHLADSISLRFEEEVHAIESVVAGQGIAICSDVLVREELSNGRLQRLSTVTLPGFGFYLVHPRNHHKEALILKFRKWAQRMK